MDYYELRKMLKDHLKVEVREHTQNEMELNVLFDDYLISKARWKKK
jgi:hypothetical protein